jgi:hypothetical protein
MDDAPATSEKAATPPAAPVLDREVSLSTPFGVKHTVRHPAGWQLITSAGDGHIGLKDPVTNGVFTTGIDESSEPVLPYARKLSLRLSEKYGQIQLSDSGKFDQANSAWSFQLELHRATTPERGVLVVEEPPSGDGATLYRWWAFLGQTEATNPVALQMANSIQTRPTQDR